MPVKTLVAAFRDLPWPLCCASVLGWLGLIGLERQLAAPGYCGVWTPSRPGGGWEAVLSALWLNPLALLLPSWSLMLLAMMSPLLADPLRLLWLRSLARKRAQTLALFLGGYALVWLAAGLPLHLFGLALLTFSPSPWLAFAVACGTAWLWQASPPRRHCLQACHRQPQLPAFGWPAAAAALRYGLSSGGWCVASCGVWMLPPLLARPGHLPMMAAVGLWLLLERRRPDSAPTTPFIPKPLRPAGRKRLPAI
ncbi:copper chaperone [Chromobacterium haemolyticum]|uniref:DUF2182 domain-containing protein n=1 Tax=Chromobacterium haemolyticum TaxID=394935 RepID=A0A1W0CC10_9NEIS|nr:DUF2182 domain-containing protein [Chromobacterium haemolyticum]OQS32276.1 hypothetical protein B0T45_22020 [Chromobacterium haemolyticum]